ncbi:MAG: hypothetical protein HDT36_00645 [Clostridiales bacterium]|nr:hypothetical protein [Clostridiales bacterium]
MTIETTGLSGGFLYAAMICRSARTESANAENLRISKVFGTDLVECIGNAVTCSVCAQYRGRVFSASGNDKRYPPLRDGVNSPLKNGYDIIHPNCRCEFRAYFEALHSKEESEAKRKFSNRPFDGDKRTVEQAKANQELQRLNRQAVEEQSRWNDMQALLGKDMPYKNMVSFRKAFRAEKDSTDYKASHNLKGDYKQYKEWQDIIGAENMPNSLAEFQELKYNDNGKFEQLKDFKEYCTDNPRATQADYQKVVRLKEAGIKGEIHIPPLEIEDVDNLEFDVYHANVESEHNVTREEAISFIKNAKVSATVWNGEYERYYSVDGASYYNVKLGSIRTAFKSIQYKGDAEIIKEEIQKWKDE